MYSTMAPSEASAAAAAAAAGTSTDPIILSSDDEDTIVNMGKSKEEQPRSSKKRRIDKEEEPAPASTGTSIKSNTFSFGGKKDFCLVVIVDPDEECRRFLKRCEQTCDPTVHRHCFQRDGTFHFTLGDTFTKSSGLTYQEAMAISFRKPTKNLFDKTQQELPTFNLTGYAQKSDSYVALGTDTSISDIVGGLSGLPKGRHLDPTKVQGKLHMSLYRVRLDKVAGEKWMDAAPTHRRNEFKRVTNAVTGGFGKAKALRIVLKEMHAAYDGLDGKFFRVWE